MFNPIRVGVLGCGNMGRNHLRVLSSMSQYKLVGCFDPVSDLSRQQAELYGITQFKTQEELFDSVELVHVVVPSFLHKEVAIAAAQSGCHVLVEKPIALTLQDAQSIIDVCRDMDVKLCIGHVERFNPAIIALSDILKNEDVLSIEFHRMSPFDKRVSDASVVQDLMIHDIDVLNWIANSPVKHVESQGIIAYSEKLDFVQAQVIFENGLVANLIGSRITESKVRKAEINARNAYITADYLDRTVTISRKTNFALEVGYALQYRQDNIIEKVFVPIVEPLRAEFMHFAQAIREGAPIQTSGEMGLKALELCDIIERNALVVRR